MRILVISLLRIGDFLQAIPVLNGIKRQNPGCELEVLTFKPVQALQELLPQVNAWWTLDRDQLQSGLGNSEVPLLASFSVLQEKLATLNARNYDLVINLSQTRFSAWLAGYLQSSERAGLSLSVNGRAHFHSPWFRYLDEIASPEAENIFNYVDIFFYGTGLRGAQRDWTLSESEHGRREATRHLLKGKSELIVLQCLTSDKKKSWPAKSWLELMVRLQRRRPAAHFVLLGAPPERAEIETLREQGRQQQIQVEAAIVSLAGAYSILKRASLLIAGDTSIKHLANSVEIPVLELSVGSSDWRRTGIYQSNSLIVQALVGCAPCPHSQKCDHGFVCHTTCNAEPIAELTDLYLTKDWTGIESFSKANRQLQILRTRTLANGFWMAQDLRFENEPALLQNAIERCAEKFILNQDHLQALAPIGSEIVTLSREVQTLVSDNRIGQVLAHLDFLESQSDQLQSRAAHLLAGVKDRKPEIAEIDDFMGLHYVSSEFKDCLGKLQEWSNDLPAIGELRRVQGRLEYFMQKAQIKLKLIRSIKSQLAEQESK